jgi:acetyl esterase/lipase
MTVIYHELYPEDRAAMVAMRAVLSTHPAIELGSEARPGFDALLAKTPAAKGVRYEAATVGGVMGLWCRPADELEGAAILYLHGGAYVLGSAAAYRNFAGQISARAGAATFVADYGLAPEQPFPRAFEDAQAVYRSLSASRFSRLALAGDSAGGGLALALFSAGTAASQDDAILRPVAAAVMSPWADLALAGESMNARANWDPLLTRNALEKAAALYLKKHERRDPQASPLYGDLTGLPPVLLHVGEDEILLDDSRRYAQEIVTCGGSAELHVWQGMVHVFPANLKLLQAARQALDETGRFLRRHLQGTI